MRKGFKIIKWIVLSGITVLVLIGLYIQVTRQTDTMIYKTNGLEYKSFRTEYNHEVYHFKLETNVTIQGVLFKPEKGIPIGTIFHYSGKGMHLMSSQKYYEALLKEGFQIFSFERRGFGKSTGIADHSLVLKRDALLIFDQMINQESIENTPIIIWGQSLGGVFATMNAAEREERIDGLVLEGTFSSFPDIGKVYASALNLENFKWIIPLLMNNDFPAEKEIKRINKPILIIHSINDKQVPYELGKKIHEASNKKNTEFWEINGKHIRAIFDHEKEYVKKFKQMIGR